MAKDNFKAKEATTDPNYAQGAGLAGQGLLGAGAAEAGQGFSDLQSTIGQQKSFADMLQSAAAGTGGPTLADQQLKDATARNNANAAGFAASSKGLNPALAARQALLAQSGNDQQAAGQAVQTRIQEQQAARAQLGGALAGEAGTAGAEASGGIGAAGTGGSIANASNANLIGSRNAANTTNAGVAAANTNAVNGAISGIANAAGSVFGLAEGGVVPGEPEGTQSDETSIALAKGGVVPAAPRLSASAGPSGESRPLTPHRSFAAQVAHHLSREYFADGGMATQPGASDAGAHEAPVSPKEEATSEPVAKEGDVKKKTEMEKERETKQDFEELEPVQKKAFGGDVDEDEDDQDNKPDTDQAVEDEEEDGSEDTQYMADGGTAGDSVDQMHATAMGNSDLEGEMPVNDPSGNALDPTGAAHKPSIFQQMGQRVGAKLAGSPIGSLLSGNLPAAKPTAPGAKNFNFEAGGPVPGKAKVAGNSLKNDTVPAQLSPGEVVLPRTISHDPKKAKAFVEHLMQHGGDGHATLKDLKKRKVA